jgi:DNA-directed RNA polymerase specialized sigma24 family protein
VVQDAPVSTEPRDAVERVWRDQGPKLWRSLVAFTGDHEIATDAMAEAFAQALGRGEAVRDHDRWIWRASFRIAAGDLKGRHRGGGDAEGSSYEIPDSVTDLVRALAALSSNQRAAAVLHYYADLPTGQVAQILGCSQATVRVHLAQARKRLRPLLEDVDE